MSNGATDENEEPDKSEPSQDQKEKSTDTTPEEEGVDSANDVMKKFLEKSESED